MSTPVFIDPEISTQADGAQSPRVPVPFPEDTYEAIRQAYLFEMDIESEPVEDPVETKTPVSPHTVASPTSLPNSTPPTRHVEESEDSDTSGARSTPLDFTESLSPDHPLPILHPPWCSHKSSPSSSSLDLPSRKHSRGTSELVEDEEEDDEVEENLDSDSESEDTKDEGPVEN
nr:hypothetical protein [Tanacetum cinerariifolium]